MESLVLTGISSMATRLVLSDLLREPEVGGVELVIESIGGVDAVKRASAGEPFDLLVLSEDVLEDLEREGRILAGSRTPFARCPMALAVRAGAPGLDVHDPAAVRAALTGMRSVGYSTGASGVHLVKVLKSWGIDPAADPARYVLAKPGAPVAALVANGSAEIGFSS